MNKIYLTLLIALAAFTMNANAQAPGNNAATLEIGDAEKSLVLNYNGTSILEGEFMNLAKITSTVNGIEAIEQLISFSFEEETTVKAIVNGSSEALAAETRGSAQNNFALVRTSHGLSNNLRNNAIYDRNLDWMIEFSEGTQIKSFKNNDETTRFEVEFSAKNTDVIFRPRYYQKHKNIKYYEPWNYNVYKGSVTGWSSWWAYFRQFSEKDHLELIDIWEEKHFADYGYNFIQIDDAFQGGNDVGRVNCELANNYLGGRPTTWLDWKKDKFPGGLEGYVKSVNDAGFNPAIWMGCFFSDEETVKQHPDWFVQNAEGKPAAAPWVSYVMDATNPEVVEALIRPTFKGLKEADVEYVKIDQLRHFLYDNLHNNLEWCKTRGIKPEDVIRAYLKVAREELGDEIFILSCWGVLTESVGLADACRIGGDGYGPVTMQQYNSWNGIVWRNDPDHCDVSPNKKAKDVGNVKELEARVAADKESIIRPALASIAGAMLMLSDKPEIYKNDAKLHGLRRSSPVLFSVPGQLYDFDSAKTDWNIANKRSDITTGKRPSPMDGDQFGKVCPYWLNEFNTSIGNWNVLHRLNWTQKRKKALKAETVKFADLGLDASKEYLVYEFWSDKMFGVLKNKIPMGKLKAYGLESFAIREKLDRPQLVSTNRHLSQGAAEIEALKWENKSLQGSSKVVVDDKYVITLYVPEGYKLSSAEINGTKALVEKNGNVLKVSYLPEKTDLVNWKVEFE